MTSSVVGKNTRNFFSHRAGYDAMSLSAGTRLARMKFSHSLFLPDGERPPEGALESRVEIFRKPEWFTPPRIDALETTILIGVLPNKSFLPK
jgi:hypothetical protein